MAIGLAHKYLIAKVYKGQCDDCKAHFPNERTRSKTYAAMDKWQRRHKIETGHSIRTAVTYVRRY